MFKKPATNATPETESTPSQPSAPWAWDLIAHVVPELPCGAVTVIVLNDEHPFASHEALVGDLMVTMLDRHRRFAFVSVGDPDTEMAEVLAHTLNDEAAGRVIGYVDRDYKVTARLGDGGGFIYSCGIPTLDNVERFLADGDEGKERLVILDGFERARPYAAVGPSLIPNTAPLSADDVDAWRSADLRAFAQSRPNAPTVVVWHGANVERDSAKRSIGDAADLVLMHRVSEEHDWLTVSVRSEHGCWEGRA